ncbi:UDP-glucose/GDP-mannose dehydrogenase family protein [Kibdelosporangium persicum]|uniref:UDP-glucose 6-dehydrogenase n=1 Tax=Kibdelosporangium persicum TaxID=2698649 RepID=A0ABX2F6H8_9PSEU|nr:UDP-glucose/GDP-mannose dehydrogenase family protein [Kibdelosporangium persicum]NRN66969.1 UDP-glucose 6-dehydrogenase [Kibdelosporangium persicum]
MTGARIAVFGAGYVGLTTAACFARLGHDVVCSDVDETKVTTLSRGEVSLHEPGLTTLVEQGLGQGRLRFVLGLPTELSEVDFVFLAVPTPTGPDGAADLSAVEAVLSQIHDVLSDECVVVIKSTVPVGTTRRVQRMIGCPVVSNPEFLREGHAVEDFTHPQRIVVGSEDKDAARRVLALYADDTASAVVSDSASAELVKYASNCFLAMKLSYVNALAELCEEVDANIEDVTEGMSLDERIGSSFLAPGPGWGGSCLPKDTKALLATATAARVDFPLLDATIGTNHRQPHRVMRKVRDAVGGSVRDVRIGLLGLTFKAGTDDLRDSPALAVAGLLAAEGAVLTGYDPCVPVGSEVGPLHVVGTARDAVQHADVVVVLTEWQEFAELDWTCLGDGAGRPVIVDTRDVLPVDKVREAGFRLIATGKRLD